MGTVIDFDTATAEEIARWVTDPIVARRLCLTRRDLEAAQYAERRSDPPDELEEAPKVIPRDTDEPGLLDYFGAVAFLVLCIVAWCWAAAL